MLEIGPGLGVLTRYLAERVAHVHAVEIDRSLEPQLRDARRERRAALRRRAAPRSAARDATKLVANLPYNVATPLIVESLDGLPGDRALVRDGAARGRGPLLRAAAHEGVRCGLRARAARGERTGFHPVSRTVFRPPPNVDSALVAFRRVALPRRLRARQARRRARRSRTGARRCRTRSSSRRRARVRRRRPRSRRSAATPTTRAEALAPPEFVALAEALA